MGKCQGGSSILSQAQPAPNPIPKNDAFLGAPLIQGSPTKHLRWGKTLQLNLKSLAMQARGPQRRIVGRGGGGSQKRGKADASPGVPAERLVLRGRGVDRTNFRITSGIMRFFWLLLPIACLQAQMLPLALLEEEPDDQFKAIVSSFFYPMYRVIDFAKDHNIPYVKILSFQFTGFDQNATAKSDSGNLNQGRVYELKNQYASISFACYDEAPNDPFVIEVEKYLSLFEDDMSD